MPLSAEQFAAGQVEITAETVRDVIALAVELGCPVPPETMPPAKRFGIALGFLMERARRSADHQ